MRLVARHLVAAFVHEHADARAAVAAWITVVQNASWAGPSQLLARYPRASLVKEGVVVFRLGGNAYRIAARVDYAAHIVRVLAVGTHAEDDRWRL
jgi:mRNA interferase HigB